MSYKFSPTASVGYNLLPTKTTPLDTRQVVSLQSDLASALYTYPGMLVSVVDDGQNNGLYMLTASDATNLQNWAKLKSSADVALTQIIDDNTSVSVTDGNGVNSKMIFTTDGTDALSINQAEILPLQNQNLGSVDNTFTNLYLDPTSVIQFGADQLSANNTALTLGGNGSYDLGALNSQWNNLYLSGDINLASGSEILVGGVPFGVPSLTLELDVNVNTGWDSFDSIIDEYIINQGTLANKDGGTIVVDNVDSQSGELVAFELDTTDILPDTKKFVIAAKLYKAAAIKLVVPAKSIVYGTATGAGDVVYVGNGQVLELWRQNGDDYYTIRTA